MGKSWNRIKGLYTLAVTETALAYATNDLANKVNSDSRTWELNKKFGEWGSPFVESLVNYSPYIAGGLAGIGVAVAITKHMRAKTGGLSDVVNAEEPK